MVFRFATVTSEEVLKESKYTSAVIVHKPVGGMVEELLCRVCCDVSQSTVENLPGDVLSPMPSHHHKSSQIEQLFSDHVATNYTVPDFLCEREV